MWLRQVQQRPCKPLQLYLWPETTVLLDASRGKQRTHPTLTKLSQDQELISTFLFFSQQMFEGAHSPPLYNDLYHFLDGAQNDIFVNSSTPSRRSADDTETVDNTVLCVSSFLTCRGLRLTEHNYGINRSKRMKHVRLGHSVGL